jgi:hypothetical protein
MFRRGTTVVAWVIGLGALAAQAVIVPIAGAMLKDRTPAPVEVTAPALPPAPQADPAADVDKGLDGLEQQVEAIALVG